MPDILLDSTHLLLLLDGLKLDNNRKFILVTADMTSLYLNLPVTVCKKHCLDSFEKFNKFLSFECNITSRELQKLLHWALDYSYVAYKDNYYIQHKGIQMGGSGSVSVCNLTISRELEQLFKNKKEITFYRRFIDDLFFIIDITTISDVNDYLLNLLDHDWLQFTYKFDERSIEFLDMTYTN